MTFWDFVTQHEIQGWLIIVITALPLWAFSSGFEKFVEVQKKIFRLRKQLTTWQNADAPDKWFD